MKQMLLFKFCVFYLYATIISATLTNMQIFLFILLHGSLFEIIIVMDVCKELIVLQDIFIMLLCNLYAFIIFY